MRIEIYIKLINEIRPAGSHYPMLGIVQMTTMIYKNRNLWLKRSVFLGCRAWQAVAGSTRSRERENICLILTKQSTGCLGDYPDTKNTLSLEQRYLIIYHWVHDLSHSNKHSVGGFLRCNVITCYNTARGNCEL
jgi:hypothetical protein